MITKNGDKLANKLAPAIGWTNDIAETCSLICRHAATHARLAEVECNREMTLWETEQVEMIQRRMTDLVASLPETDDGPFTVYFQGDPRGATVKIEAPDPWKYLYDGW